MKRTADALVLTFLTAGLIAAKLTILNVPAYWDEMRWAGESFRLAEWPLVAVFPGFRPAQAFAGHPPGIHLLLAVAAKVAGSTMQTAHLVAIAFGAIGLCFTYLLGARIFDRWTGAVAALLLFCCPMYFAQSGMFLADVPVAALSTGCVYFVLMRRTRAYLACAIAMVLVKETAAAIVLAMLAYDMFVAEHERSARLRAAGRHLVPLLVLGIFVMWQKIVTGSWWLIYDEPFETSSFSTTLGTIARQGWAIATCVFVEQWRWLMSVPLAMLLLADPGARRRRELWLLGLIALCGSVPYAFAGNFFLPRYLMPILPLFFVATAWAVRRLIQSLGPRTLVAAGLLSVMVWSLAARPFSGTAELNMRYLDVVRVHQAMASAIERDFASARVLTVWPHLPELGIPQLGYVRAPISVADAKEGVDLDRALANADLVWVTVVPSTRDMIPLRDRVVGAGWRVVRTFSAAPVVSELFAPPR